MEFSFIFVEWFFGLLHRSSSKGNSIYAYSCQNAMSKIQIMTKGEQIMQVRKILVIWKMSQESV